MKLKKFTFLLISTCLSASHIANADTKTISEDTLKKIISAGVPEKPLKRLLSFRDSNMNRTFQQDVYTCPNKDLTSVKPCKEELRVRTQTSVTIKDHKYAVLIDFTKTSIEKRFFLINFENGKVDKFQVAHGLNTGELYAYKFSNIKDSKQTSLGIFVTGKTYYGDHNLTLRMYGLEKSNDQAYIRDIVMHGAKYAVEDFPERMNSNTGFKFNRLGVSWGCPAVAPKIAEKIIPLLLDGALIYHSYPELEDEALSGKEVSVPNPEYPPQNVIPTPRPEFIN